MRNRYMDAKMTPAQCRMARAALGMGVRELSVLADVSTNTISRFETSDAPGTGTVSLIKDRTIKALRAALEAAGIQFIAPGDTSDGTGVSLK